MRAKIFLLKASCILLSAFLICGNTTLPAYCQQMVASVTTAQPEFMAGVEMSLHYKKEVIINIVTPAAIAIIPKKAEVPVVPVIAMPPETPGRMLLPVNDSTMPAIGAVTPAIPDSAAPAATSPTPTEHKEPEQVTITKPDATQEKGTTIIAISETHPDFNDPASFIEEVADPVIIKYADMISLEPSDISNYPLYRFIDEWYGVKYRWGGSTRKGIDCSALSQKLYTQVYNTKIKRTSKQQFRNCERFKKHTEASEGDLVFFRINRIRLSHVGVYLANGYFVHASRGHGVMISNLENKYWRRRYASCGRIEREETEAESDYAQ